MSENVKNCQKMSKIVKNVENCQLCQKCRKLSKMSKISKFQKCQKFSKMPKIVKNLKNCQKYQNCQIVSENLIIFSSAWANPSETASQTKVFVRGDDVGGQIRRHARENSGADLGEFAENVEPRFRRRRGDFRAEQLHRHSAPHRQDAGHFGQRLPAAEEVVFDDALRARPQSQRLRVVSQTRRRRVCSHRNWLRN